jgi:vacuolar-type H+-ATPase subunit B/Vma2
LDIGWKLLSVLPREELTRVSREEIQSYHRGEDAGN